MTYDDSLIRKALTIVNDHDADRARHQNGVGFNRFDGDFARDLLARLTWTPRQQAAAWKLANKYRGQHQLNVPKPPEPQSRAVTPIVRSADVVGDVVVFTFPFDRAVNEFLKRTQGARWDGDLKRWYTPVARFDAVALQQLVNEGWAVTPAVQTAAGVATVIPTAPIAPAPVAAPVSKPVITLEGTQAVIPSLQGHPNFSGVLADIKGLPGRRWNPTNQTNLVDPTTALVAFAEKWGYELAPEISVRDLSVLEALPVLVRRASYAKHLDDVPAEIQDGALKRIQR